MIEHTTSRDLFSFFDAKADAFYEAMISFIRKVVPSTPIRSLAVSFVAFTLVAGVLCSLAVLLLPWANGYFSLELPPGYESRGWMYVASIPVLMFLVFATVAGARSLVSFEDTYLRNLQTFIHHNRLEVRGLAFVVNGDENADAWRRLSHWKFARRPNASEGEGKAPGAAQPIPAGPFVRAFERIAPYLPVGRPLQVLIWPGSAGCATDLSLAAEVLDRREHRFVIHTPEPMAPCAVTAAFDLLAKHPSMSLLLVVSATRIGFGREGAGGLVSSVTLALLARPDRIPKSASTDVHAERPSRQRDFSASGLLSFLDKETSKAQMHPIAIEAAHWRPIAKDFMAQASSAGITGSGRGIYAPAPWTLTQLRMLRSAPRLGFVYRPLPISESDGATGIAERRNDFEGAWRVATSRLPEGMLPQRVLTEKTVSSGGMSWLYKRLCEVAPVGAEEITPPFSLSYLVGDLGQASSLTAVALAIQASNDAGDCSAILLNRGDQQSFMMVSPGSQTART